MSARPTTTSPRVAVYVRADQLGGGIDTHLRTLRRLAAGGSLANLTVRAWPAEVVLSEETPDCSTISVFKRAREWASSVGASIPAFGVHTVQCSLTDEVRTVMRPPTICVLVYDGERLESVYPHVRGGDRVDVTAAIRSLRRTVGRAEDDPDIRQIPEIRCSRCERPMLLVQGLAVCHHCDRVELTTSDDEGEGVMVAPGA